MTRLTCIVPFCRHTRKDADKFNEWICGDHWRLIEKKYRRVYGRRARRWRRFRTGGEAGARLWAWMKRRAIERAAGIA
jgi:hypothetical protein